jgi:hypothetical protein
MKQATAFDLARWSHQLETLDRELEHACQRHPGWPRCDCQWCQVAQLVADAVWTLNHAAPDPRPAA